MNPVDTFFKPLCHDIENLWKSKDERTLENVTSIALRVSAAVIFVIGAHTVLFAGSIFHPLATSCRIIIGATLVIFSRDELAIDSNLKTSQDAAKAFFAVVREHPNPFKWTSNLFENTQSEKLLDNTLIFKPLYDKIIKPLHNRFFVKASSV